jgi:hypothetical protein
MPYESTAKIPTEVQHKIPPWAGPFGVGVLYPLIVQEELSQRCGKKFEKEGAAVFRRHLKATVGALLLGLLAGSPAVATVTHPVLSQETNRLIVYLGVVPAKRLNDHAELLPAGHAIRTGKDMYHILLSGQEKICTTSSLPYSINPRDGELTVPWLRPRLPPSV